MLKRVVCTALMCLPLAACGLSETATDPLTEVPTLRIADAAHNGDQHFYFLPPLAWQPEYSGDFDPSAQPEVNICEVDENDCIEVVTYRAGTESHGSTLRADPDGEFYHVNWHTNQFELNVNSVYRIRVVVGGAEVGYLDVLLVENKSKVRSGGRDGLIPLVDGRTAPIKFRIEQGLTTNQEPEPPPEPNTPPPPPPPPPPPAIPEGAILGTVTDGDGAALMGMTVSALDNGVVVSQATTTEDGSYVLPVADAYAMVKLRFEDPNLAHVGECYNDVPLMFCNFQGALVPRGSVAIDAVLNRVP
jgi:hypothetical protein